MNDPYRSAKFQPPIVQNPLTGGYRQTVPTSTQDAPQGAKRLPYPQTIPSSYRAAVPEFGGRDIDTTLTSAFGRLGIATQPHTSQNINVVLFGEPGVGKSAVVNLIARRNIAKVASSAYGFTLQSTRYDISLDDINVSIFETDGLKEPEISAKDYLVVLEKVYEFVQQLSAVGGVHLLLFCIRADRLTATTQSNYRLFSKVVFQTKVPIALIVTGLEGEREMEDWWARNRTLVEHYGLKCDEHACITTVTDRSARQNYNHGESQKKIRELLKNYRLTTPTSLPEPRDWFIRLGNGIQQFIDKRYQKPTRGDITNTLTHRLKLDPQTIQGFLSMMERGDAQLSRGGVGRPQGAPSARGNQRDLEAEAGPSRRRESDAGKRPQRSASLDTVHPRNPLDSGKRNNEPPTRKATGEQPIAQSPSRYWNAGEEDRGGRWDDNARRGEMTTGKAKVEPLKANMPMETYTKSPTDLSMDDIRLNFPHDLTGYVTRSDQYAFASGSFGDVFRGMFNVRGKLIEVAIKVYKVYTQRDEHRLKRFNKEIDVWLKLQHPNVLPLFGTIRDTRMHPDIPAMVCPWVANGSLSGHLDRNKELPVTARLVLINDVALGLQYLHSQRVVHGDLSGSNVLVRADGRAYIADFGLSTLLTAVGGPSVASSRQNGGTVRWMAPELLNPQNPSPPSPTSRSDVYSFGSIMFQTLTGNIPYHHLSRDEQVIWAILQGTKPDRPSYKALTNGRWTFIERCWSSGGGRPSSDKIVEFTSRDLAESMAGRI